MEAPWRMFEEVLGSLFPSLPLPGAALRNCPNGAGPGIALDPAIAGGSPRKYKPKRCGD